MIIKHILNNGQTALVVDGVFITKWKDGMFSTPTGTIPFSEFLRLCIAAGAKEITPLLLHLEGKQEDKMCHSCYCVWDKSFLFCPTCGGRLKEKEPPKDNEPPFIWKAKDGYIAVKDMSDEHITACLDMLRDRGYGTVRRTLWIQIFEQELQSR